MGKNIKLKMDKNKSLRIFLDDAEKHIINANDRSITAEKIYGILEFTNGNCYTVSSENDTGIDAPVVDFFVELFNDITNRVNLLSISEQDESLDTTPE
jgi:hypothetical protein